MTRSHLLFLSGSAESMVRFRSAWLAALVAGGHRVTVATPTHERAWVERLAALGVTVVPWEIARTGLNPLADVGRLLELRRIVRAANPDAMVAYAHKPVLYGLAVSGGRPFYAVLTGLGYVFTGDGVLRRLIRGAFRLVYPLLLRRARALLFLNPDDAACFRDAGLVPKSVSVTVLPGEGIDTEKFAETPPPARPVSFLMLARLLRDKGVREYAEAARRVRAARPEVSFHLAGGVDANPAAIPEAEVRGWAREGVLTWHGQVADVRPLIAACSVYVLPSYREGLPVSVLEAMSMGRPVIATDVPGCRTAVTHDATGLLVPARDAGALADAMLRLVDAEAERLRLGRNARAEVERRFANDRVVAQLMALLQIPETPKTTTNARP